MASTSTDNSIAEDHKNVYNQCVSLVECPRCLLPLFQVLHKIRPMSMGFSLWCFAMFSGSSGSLHETFQSGFFFPCSSIVFLLCIPYSFSKLGVLWTCLFCTGSEFDMLDMEFESLASQEQICTFEISPNHETSLFEYVFPFSRVISLLFLLFVVLSVVVELLFIQSPSPFQRELFPMYL